MTGPDRSRLELRPPEEERLRALRSQRRSAIPRGCLWWSAWLVVGAGIWAAGILIVASVLATPRAAQESVVDLRIADHGYRDDGSLPVVALGQLGAPHASALAPSGITLGLVTEPVESGQSRGAPPLAAVTRDSNPQNVGLYPTISHAAPRSAPVQPAQSGAPPVASSPAQLERLRVSTVGSGVGVRVASVPTDHLSGAPPLAVTRTGIASWFDARGYQGAVAWWKPGQQPVWATVSRFADGKTYSVTLLITGFCQCLAGQPGERLIDVSPAAFQALGAPLSVGLIEVTMQVPVQGPPLPATDEEGP